ncbi:N-acetyltransferase [Wenzhouxiangella sp. XN79A]|uniref:N-acetyltransferase n=1 Tax=Wenzhouxiangella sp. XN79A TaxID=2724193 RepID=UPI00144A53C2|nr:N-acetyltransferase [Wenzhouxiangella sp. XN79A]NKI36003.1 N-acetyltransferase [Wenzhouxiangella sp. XN79A]
MTTPESTIEVRPVRLPADWRRFHALPVRLYAGDPNWVRPLDLQLRQQWAPRNPFFAHAEAQAFIALRGDRAVGRISAQIDRLNDDRGRPDLGWFGQLEAEDDIEVFRALERAAGGWLAERGRTRMQGPFDLSINQQSGLLVDGFDSPPMMMMGHARPYYADRLVELGFESVAELLAYQGDLEFRDPRGMRRVLGRLGDRLRLERVERGRLMERAGLMRELFNAAWADNWGFVPMTEAEFDHTVQDMKLLIRPGYVQIAWLDDEPAAFMVTLPDLNELVRDLGGRLFPFGAARLLWRIWRRRSTRARVPLMGVAPKYQRSITGAALSYAMVADTRDHLKADGVEWTEQSWILEQNRGMRSLIESIDMHVAKRYRVFERSIGSSE